MTGSDRGLEPGTAGEADIGRMVADLRSLAQEFLTLASELDRQVLAEEQRTGVRDPAHYTYSTFARSARQRRDNLRVSAAALEARCTALLAEAAAAAEAAPAPPAPRTARPMSQPEHRPRAGRGRSRQLAGQTA